MASEVADLYTRYLDKLKPLVAEYESQNEQIMPSCLVNLSLMFDRVALSETAETEKERHSLLVGASEHLETVINDTRSGVIARHILTINKFKQTYGQDIINTLKDGKFVGPFRALENEARQSLGTDDEISCGKLSAMVDMINESYAGVLAANTVKDSRTTIFLKWSFTIAISILVALLTVWLI